MKKKQNKQTPQAPSTRSWREIRQSGSEKAFTHAARKRKATVFLKAATSLCGLIFVLGAGTWLLINWYDSPEFSLTREEGEPIRRIVYQTDGVLNRERVSRLMAIPGGTSLMEVSIFELKRKLEANGQIESAHVAREFPDTLKVSLKERKPVCRIALANEFGGYETLLVSAEGIVYEGSHYDREFLETLPYLGGVSLRREKSGGIEPIEGMLLIADFLDVVKDQYPRYYRHWRVITLEGIGKEENIPGAGFRVRGRNFPSTRFSATEYHRQLEKLTTIMQDLPKRVEAENRGEIEKIDLSLDGPVVVSFSPQKP